MTMLIIVPQDEQTTGCIKWLHMFRQSLKYWWLSRFRAWCKHHCTYYKQHISTKSIYIYALHIEDASNRS
jgi:hypothetical protein